MVFYSVGDALETDFRSLFVQTIGRVSTFSAQKVPGWRVVPSSGSHGALSACWGCDRYRADTMILKSGLC